MGPACAQLCAVRAPHALFLWTHNSISFPSLWRKGKKCFFVESLVIALFLSHMTIAERLLTAFDYSLRFGGEKSKRDRCGPPFVVVALDTHPAIRDTDPIKGTVMAFLEVVKRPNLPCSKHPEFLINQKYSSFPCSFWK